MPSFPVTVIYLTKNRTLYKEKSNSKNTFNSILEKFENNSRYKNEAKLKKYYFLNGKEIKKNQLLEEIIKQDSEFSPNLDQVELSLELEELHYTGDSSYFAFKKIIQPKANPFSLYVFSPKDKTIIIKSFPERIISLFELKKFNEGSAYCNSYNDLYISGGNNNNKDFWIINNNSFDIKKKNMPMNKKNHSMIYLKTNEKEEWVFIVGGTDKKTFYYDLKKNFFMNWGDVHETHIRPSLIQIGEYLYIIDSIDLGKISFERTKLISPNKRWEKVTPRIDSEISGDFPSNFGISFDSTGKILLLGGENLSVNNTYIYEPGSNTIVLSQNGTNDSTFLNDKTFYKVSKRYSIALPKNLYEEKEICAADKEDQSLIKIFVKNSSDNNKFNVSTNLSFEDKLQYISKNKGNLTINIINKEEPNKNKNDFNQPKANNFDNNMNNNEGFNQQMHILNPMICDKCIIKNTFVCQCCHNTFQRHNFNPFMNFNNNYNYNPSYQQNQNQILRNYNQMNQMNQPNDNPTRENPKVTIIEDEYYPTLSDAYKKYLNNMKKKGYEHKVYNINYNRALDKAKVDITYDDYTPIKIDYKINKPGEVAKKYVYAKKEKEKEVIRKNEEEVNIKKEEKINININDNKNIENDVVEYKNNEQENKDDDLFLSDDHKQSQNQNDVIIEENHNYNEEIEGQQEQNDNLEEVKEKEEKEEKEEIGVEEKNEKIENREEFKDMEEQNEGFIENGENHEEQEQDNLENIDNNQNQIYNSGEKDMKEENIIISTNKEEIINGELPKDSLEFNDAGKIHNEENDNFIKPQHELDFNNEEINNHNENQDQENNINIIDNMRMGINFTNDNHNENNNIIVDNKNENEIKGDEEFHSMNENENEENMNGEEGNNSVQHIENGNNEELYENGKEIKFDVENENENENQNENENENLVNNNGEIKGENINKEDENKIVEYEGEGGDGINVEEEEIHEVSNGEEAQMENNEEGEMNYEQEGEIEGEAEQGQGEEFNYEEGNGEEMNYENEGEEGEEMNYEEGMEEGNNSVFENNDENEQNEQNSQNNEGENNGES